MDLAKFIGLLSRGVFFALPSVLRRIDPWEGCWSDGEFEIQRAKVHGLQAVDAQQAWDSAVKAQFHELDHFGISCWHQSDEESAALWSLYVARGMGVTVKSSTDRLTQAMAEYADRFRLAAVEYSDPTAENAPPVEGDPLLRKRRAFGFEQEVRGLLRYSEDEKRYMKHLEEVYGSEPARVLDSLSDPSAAYMVGHGIVVNDNSAIRRTTTAGVYATVDLATVIDRVLLPPQVDLTSRHAVRVSAKAFGLNLGLIRESAMDIPPFHRVRLHQR